MSAAASQLTVVAVKATDIKSTEEVSPGLFIETHLNGVRWLRTNSDWNMHVTLANGFKIDTVNIMRLNMGATIDVDHKSDGTCFHFSPDGTITKQ
jgi:hypothetical protein